MGTLWRITSTCVQYRRVFIQAWRWWHGPHRTRQQPALASVFTSEPQHSGPLKFLNTTQACRGTSSGQRFKTRFWPRHYQSSLKPLFGLTHHSSVIATFGVFDPYMCSICWQAALHSLKSWEKKKSTRHWHLLLISAHAPFRLRGNRLFHNVGQSLKGFCGGLQSASLIPWCVLTGCWVLLNLFWGWWSKDCLWELSFLHQNKSYLLQNWLNGSSWKHHLLKFSCVAYIYIHILNFICMYISTFKKEILLFCAVCFPFCP